MSTKKKTEQNEKVIDKLTDAQKAKMNDYVEEYSKISFSTEQTTRADAENFVRQSYEYFHKLNGSCVASPEFVWAGSPMEGAKLAAQYAKGNTDVTRAEIQEQALHASYGSFEAYWVATWAFITNELPIEKDPLVDIAIGIVKNCGVYWTFEDIVVMTPKPTAIVMKDKKLHNTEGPVLCYSNGDSIYAVEGVVKGSLLEVAIAGRVGEEIENKTA